MTSISYKQDTKRGHRKAFVPRSPTGSCLVSDWEKIKQHTLERQRCRIYSSLFALLFAEGIFILIVQK